MIKKFLYNKKLAPYVLALPFLISLCVFFIYPVIYAFIMSFQSILPGQVEWVGFSNYTNLIGTKAFNTALRNSLVYTALTLLVLIPMPMVLATMVHSKFARGKGLFRAVLFIPALVSIPVAGVIVRLALGDLDTAFLNSLVTSLGFSAQKWISGGNQWYAWGALLFIASWRWMGVNMLYYLAGLDSIPSELYESASIDGAGTLQTFFRITVPMLKNTTIYVLTISIYGGMSMFTESLILFNSSQTPREVGLTLMGLLYRESFLENKMGSGAAIGVMLLLFTLGVNLIQLRFFGYYKKED